MGKAIADWMMITAAAAGVFAFMIFGVYVCSEWIGMSPALSLPVGIVGAMATLAVLAPLAEAFFTAMFGEEVDKAPE